MAEETNFKISQAIRFLKESFDPDAPVNVDQITSALVEHFDKRFRDDFLQSMYTNF